MLRAGFYNVRKLTTVLLKVLFKFIARDG